MPGITEKLGSSYLLLCILTGGIVQDSLGSRFYFTIPFCNDTSLSVLVVPLEPMIKRISVVISTDSTIEEFFVSGQKASRLSLQRTNCTWNTLKTSSGINVKISSSVVLYVEMQRSKFVIPPMENLGKGYTLLTFWDEDLRSLESHFVFSAPFDSTTVYIDSRNTKDFSVLFHETWFHQGDLFQFDLNAGDSVFVRCEFDVSGIKINSSNPLFVAVGTQHRDEDFITVQLPNEMWGRRFLIDDPGSIVFWGNSNSSLTVRTSSNDVKIYNFEYFPANLSFSENQTFPCILSFSTPVVVSQRLLIEHTSATITRIKNVIPVSLYFHKNVFSEGNHLFCSPKYTRYSSIVPARKKTSSNKTISVEEEQFSSVLFVFKTTNDQIFVKELRKMSLSQFWFSGYLFCSPGRHLYPHPSAWHAFSCETNKDTGCVQNVLMENGPILIKVIPDPYIPSSITSVTFSLVSGIVAAIVFIALAYLADLIRTRIAGSTRIGTLIE